MSTSQATISREVRRFMTSSRLSQGDIATALGIHQTAVSKKLLGTRPWSLSDIDRLRDLGVPVCVSAGSWEAWS